MDNPLIKQQEEYDKIASLEGLIKSNLDPRELKRAIAVKMAIEGCTDRMITQVLGVSKSFIRDWKKAFNAEGVAGIKLGYQGAKGKLTTEQRAEIIEWLKNKNYWHLDELINHIEDKYNVVYKSKQSYDDLFELGKISWKRSQKVNPKFDEELVKKKRDEINEFLAKHKTEIETGAMVVLFIDECHLLNGDICGYVWGQTSIRIEIPIENEKKRMRSGRVSRPWKRTKHRQTYFGALNYQTKEFTIEGYPAGNGESTVGFVKYLQSKYSQAKIVLIWDGASYHRFGEFRDFLEKVNNETPADERKITCILFAPNAPQQNPVEDIWLQAKNFLRKYWYLCKSFRPVKKLFELFCDCSKFDFPKINQYYFSQEIK
jgi:transposase